MTLSEISRSPIGTTHYFVEQAGDVPAFRPDMEFRATHWERVSQGIRIRVFYSCDASAAYNKAAEYDRKRKELGQKWQDSAKQRRERL